MKKSYAKLNVTLVNNLKKKIEELRESENRFQQVVENAQEWIWEVDANGLYTFASPIVEKILGYKPKELIGKKHFYDLFNPKEKEVLKKAAFQFFSKKKSFRNFINKNVHKNGKTIILEMSGTPILDSKGELLGYRGADIDITERKKTEEELRKYREHLEEMVEEKTKELQKQNINLVKSAIELAETKKDLEDENIELTKRFNEMKILL